MPPIIGVTTNYGVDADYDPPRERATLLAEYTEAILVAGGIPHILPIPLVDDARRCDALLRSVDGIMFTGGLDLDPVHYGQAAHPRTKLLHERRSRYEVELFRQTDTLRLPMLAVCLGFQIAHVARGGRLVQHIDDLNLSPKITHYLPRDANAFHDVRIEPDSTLARVVGTTNVQVTSRHHQIVDPDQPGQNLRSVAWAPDNVLEASEDMDGRFLLAVQWHPEDLLDRPEHVRLFDSLVQAAGG